MGGEFNRCPACSRERDPYDCPRCGTEGQHAESESVYPEWQPKKDGPIPVLMLQGLELVITAHSGLAQDEHGVAGMLEREAAFRRYQIEDSEHRDMLHDLWDEIQAAVIHEKNRKLEKEAERRNQK